MINLYVTGCPTIASNRSMKNGCTKKIPSERFAKGSKTDPSTLTAKQLPFRPRTRHAPKHMITVPNTAWITTQAAYCAVVSSKNSSCAGRISALDIIRNPVVAITRTNRDFVINSIYFAPLSARTKANIPSGQYSTILSDAQNYRLIPRKG